MGGVNFICLHQMGDSINYKKRVDVWYRGGSFSKRGELIHFLTNFFKVVIFIFILSLRLCYMFGYNFL